MRILQACLLMLIISGCSSQGEYTGYSVQEEYDNPHANNLYSVLDRTMKNSRYDEQASNVKLVEVSTSVSQSLRELAQIQRSVNSVDHFKDDPKIIQVKLNDKTTIDWTGPVESVLKRIAKTSHLSFRTIGNPPPVPVIVSVNKRDVLITDLIRDIAYQVQSQASVILTKDRIVEVRYL